MLCTHCRQPIIFSAHFGFFTHDETGTRLCSTRAATPPALTIRGATVTVFIEPDSETDPSEFDSSDEVQVKSWRSDAWHYVGVSVQVDLDTDLPVSIGTNHSLWGIEDSDFDEHHMAPGSHAQAHYVNNEVVPDLLQQCLGDLRDAGFAVGRCEAPPVQHVYAETRYATYTEFIGPDDPPF